MRIIPQKVAPSVNHWRPDTVANSTGWEERRVPTMDPTTIPELPSKSVSDRDVRGIGEDEADQQTISRSSTLDHLCLDWEWHGLIERCRVGNAHQPKYLPPMPTVVS